MQMSHASLLISLSLLIAAPASANPVIAIAPPDPIDPMPLDPVEEPDAEIEIGLQLGALTGSSAVGEVNDLGVGIGVAALLQLADLALVGEFDHIRIGGSRHEGHEVRGTLTRGGLALRHRLGNLAPDGDPMTADVWLEVGAGRQWIAWHEGGVLTRNDVTVGAAIQLGGVLGDDDRSRAFGPYFAVRTIISRAPRADGDAMSTCGSSCDDPGRPSANDFSTLLSFGMHWGR